VWGGRIFGDGMLCSNISYQGPLTPVFEGWIPTLWLNGCNFANISDLSFSGPADPNGKTVCLWWGPDGDKGGSSAHGNLITNISTTGPASYGIIHGSTASAANSENTYLNCGLFGRHDIGLFLSGSNTLNMRFLGGQIDSCNTGIETNNAAAVPIIENVAFANNLLDIDLEASSNAVITGIRSESAQLLRCNTKVVVTNCQMSMSGDRIQASISGNVMTVTQLGNRGTTVFPGLLVLGGSLPANQNQFRVVKQLSGGQPGGVGTYELNQGANIAQTELRVVPVFAELVGACCVSLDTCGNDNNQAILGGNNSTLHIRNNGWYSSNDGRIAPDLISAFNGQIFEYDIASRGGEFVVANLPEPAGPLKGVRMFVTDANETSFGTPVTGGGSHTVPLFCNGTAWVVG
jgi:hypothetical protein